MVSTGEAIVVKTGFGQHPVKRTRQSQGGADRARYKVKARLIEKLIDEFDYKLAEAGRQ